MLWPFRNKEETRYWLKVFGYYTLAEAAVQLIFFFIFNTFTRQEGSNVEYHLLMLVFHCLLIWPIWWVAQLVHRQPVYIQVLVNLAFAFIYGYFWFGPVQDLFAYLYNNILDLTQPEQEHSGPTLDSYMHFQILNYQIVKHAFRLSWYYLADYLHNYRSEEKKRIELAVSNKELQLKLLKWHLNPSFYFRTVKFLQGSAARRPDNASGPILQLAKVMEYVIYEARHQQVEMDREMDFLSSYVKLINQQLGKEDFIVLGHETGNDKLKIAPLLLAGLVDNIMAASSTQGTGCTIRISTSGTELQLGVTGLRQGPGKTPLLDELYKGRYTENFSTDKGYQLSLRLHAD